jgi:hypothetical protein
MKQLLLAMILAGAVLSPAFAQAPNYHVYRNTRTCQASVADEPQPAEWIQIFGPCAFTACFAWIVANCEGGPDTTRPHFCQRNLCPR